MLKYAKQPPLDTLQRRNCVVHAVKLCGKRDLNASGIFYRRTVLSVFYLPVLNANDSICAACDAFIVGDDDNGLVVLFVHLVQE